MNALINRRFRQRGLWLDAPRPNVPPSQLVPIARLDDGEPIAEQMKWQIRCRVGEVVRPIANARSDKLYRFSPYRDGITNRRCVLGINAFLEWTTDKTDRRPRRISPAEGEVFFIAGFFQQENAEGDLACCLLTTDANPTIAAFHDRMPVLLFDNQIDEWLGADSRSKVERLAVPAPSERIRIELADTALNKVPR